MRRPIEPVELLRLAGALAGERAGAGRPRTVDLRRAASTAYYALFHRLALATAAHVLPHGGPGERYGVARYVTHTAIRRVCVWVAGETPPKHLGVTMVRLRASAEVSAVALTFVELQQAREAADYDHTADHTRAGVLALVRKAEGAVSRVEEGDDDLDALLGLIALQTTLR